MNARLASAFEPDPEWVPRHLRRPKFHTWLIERGIDDLAASKHLDVDPAVVRRARLPFSDPQRWIPSIAALEKILVWTGGEIGAADFYPARLLGRNLWSGCEVNRG